MGEFSGKQRRITTRRENYNVDQRIVRGERRKNEKIIERGWIREDETLMLSKRLSRRKLDQGIRTII